MLKHQENLEDRLSTVKNALGELRNNVSVLKDQENSGNRLSIIENSFDVLNNNVSLLEDQENLKDRFFTVENALSVLKSNVSVLENQENLEGRLFIVENVFNVLKNNVSVLEEYEYFENRLETLAAYVKRNMSDLVYKHSLVDEKIQYLVDLSESVRDKNSGLTNDFDHLEQKLERLEDGLLNKEQKENNFKIALENQVKDLENMVINILNANTDWKSRLDKLEETDQEETNKNNKVQIDKLKMKNSKLNNRINEIQKEYEVLKQANDELKEKLLINEINANQKIKET